MARRWSSPNRDLHSSRYNDRYRHEDYPNDFYPDDYYAEERIVETHNHRNRHHNRYYSPERQVENDYPRPQGRKVEKPEERNLYEWGKWRTTINDNIITDVMRNESNPYPSIDRLVKANDGSYVHDRTGRKVKGDPSFVMNYSLSTNQATELSPEEFLTFGIPRAKVDMAKITANNRHSAKRTHSNRQNNRFENKYKEEHFTRNHADYNDKYKHRQGYDNHKRDINPGYDRRGENHRGQRQYSRDQRPDRPIENGRQESNTRRSKPRAKDTHQYNENNQSLSDENSVINHDNSNFFTPRTDYTPRQDSESDRMPETMKKVFAQHTGAHKPVKVFPDVAVQPAARIPTPPPPPPLPGEKK